MFIAQQVMERVRDHQNQYSNLDNFSASSFGNCLARQLFRISGYEDEDGYSGRTLVTFGMGDAIEDYGKFLFRQTGFPVIAEQHKLEYGNPPIKGRIDGILLKDNVWWAFDIKTANKENFNKWLKAAGLQIGTAKERGWASFDPREIPNTEYRPVLEENPNVYWQAQAYMHFVNQEEGYNVYGHEIHRDGMYFLVFSKNDSILYEEYCPYDKERIEARLKKLNKGYKAVHKASTKSNIEIIRKYREFGVESVIDRDTKKERKQLQWQCRYCPYMKLDWGEEEPKLVEEALKKHG